MNYATCRHGAAWVLLTLMLGAGCQGDPLKTLMGEGFRTKDPTLSTELRNDPPSEKGTGVSSKSREIERRLGYE